MRTGIRRSSQEANCVDGRYIRNTHSNLRIRGEPRR
jgi:hypothetical protein